MRLTWHIIQKDLRRLWLPLVLWGALILVQYVVWMIHNAEVNEHGSAGATATAMLWLWGAQLLMAWLLVPQLLEDDPLHHERAAWRTRPISAGRMLAAKLGGMALMLWLWPSLCTLPWWIEFDYGVAEIARTLAVNMLGMAAFTGVALLVAVLTGNFARFVLWSVVAVVAIGLGGLIVVAGMPAEGEGVVSGAILMTRAALACGIGWVTIAVVVPLQFLKRAPRLAHGVVAAGAVLAIGVVQAWPWSAAQMLAKVGGGKYSLPAVTARATENTLVLPGDPARQRAKVCVTTRFSGPGLAAGDVLSMNQAKPKWPPGMSAATEPVARLENSFRLRPAAVNLARGTTAPRTVVTDSVWEVSLPGQAATPLKNGAVVMGARNSGTVWRGELGPSVPVRTGAWAARGLRQLHLTWVGTTTQRDWQYDYDRERRDIRWVQTESLAAPQVLLELINADGMGRRRYETMLLMNGDKSILDLEPEGKYNWWSRYLARGRIPVGMLGVRQLSSMFEQDYRVEANVPAAELASEGATLTSVVFAEAAPVEVTLADSPFVPDLVVEAHLDDALQRARAEEKLVLVRMKGRKYDDAASTDTPFWTYAAPVRELMMSHFVCAQVGGPEVERLRKKTDEEDSSVIVVLKANGEEVDRLRDLYSLELQTALQANLAGKTYAAALMEMLAARGGTDQRVRFQLHEALRARGELAGAFDAILWMVEHPRAPFEGTDVFNVGWRIERYVASDASARAILLQRRDQAVANLRHDPRDAGAARMLFAITLGLRRDEATWRDFPRVMPRENPLWWEFTRNWVNRSVSQKEYRETAKAVDLEKFFADGPAWVRAQLMAKRQLMPDSPPATIRDWQRQLVAVGVNCVEALAGAKQTDAALRVVAAVRQINGSAETRSKLADALSRAGARVEAARLRMENNL